MDSLPLGRIPPATPFLKSFYAIARLAADPDMGLDELFRRAAELLVCAWPQAAPIGVRIHYDGVEFADGGCRPDRTRCRVGFCQGGEIAVDLGDDPYGVDECSDVDREFIAAVAEQLCAAILRRQVRAALVSSEAMVGRRLAVEDLVARVTATFVNVAPGELDATIDAALARLGEFAGVGRCYLFLLTADRALMDNTHEWCAAGVEPQKPRLQGLPVDVFPWWMARLHDNEVIDVRDLDQLPVEAVAEREILQAQSIVSVLVVPFRRRGRLGGFIGFDWVRDASSASSEDIRLLRLVAQVIGEALEQQAGARQLRRFNRALRISSACGASVIHVDDEQALFEQVCRQIVEVGGYALAWVGLARAERTVAPVASAGEASGYLDTLNVTWDDGPNDDGPGARAMRTARVQVVADLARDGTSAPWSVAAQARGLRSVIALPLHRDGSPFALLAIYSREPDAFDSAEVHLLSGLADNLAFGVRALRERAARRAADATLQLSKRVIEAARNGIVIAEARAPAFAIGYVNPAFEAITGYRAEEVLGLDPLLLAGNDLDQPALVELQRVLSEQRSATLVLRNYRKDGSLFWNELFLSPVHDADGRLTHYVGILNDITERQRVQAQLERQSQYDDLTGLPNRTLVRDRLERALIHAERTGRMSAVLFVDLDRFKLVNDSLGHPAGDELLRVVTGRLLACARQEDTLARYGGDEFVLVLVDVISEETASRIARRLLEHVGRPLPVSGHDLHMTASIGISLYPRDGRNADALLQYADAAMHQAKRIGRNSIQYFREELNARLLERLTLEGRLQRAIDQGELRIHYQPQIQMRNGRLAGLEALVRWQHPDLGLVPPVRFIPLAEESGLILSLGAWVLRAACVQNRHWQGTALADVPIAVNLSVKQLEQEHFPAQVMAILAETGLPPHLLELEVTESALMVDPERMVERLRAIKVLGCKLSLDDFGTGYSNLSYLKRFPFDRLKIDQSFVRGITTDPQDAAIARTIIAMARTLGLEVLAEGVETETQFNYLRRNGCNLVQGYWLGYPESAEELQLHLGKGQEARILSSLPEQEQPALLVVDDDPNTTSALARLLRREDYRVLTTNDPLEAFDLLALHEIHVLLTDQRMAQMTGTELLRRVKELHPNVVRIILSGYTELATVTEAVNQGWIYKFLTKPWDGEVLRAQLREAFERYERSRGPRDGGDT